MPLPMTLHLQNLKLMARLGVFEWERQSLREFPTQVEVKLQTADGIREDDLQSTLDYAELESFLLEHAQTGEWQLVERLVESLVEAALAEFAIIDEIAITIDKPQALEKSESVGLTYRKSRA